MTLQLHLTTSIYNFLKPLQLQCTVQGHSYNGVHTLNANTGFEMPHCGDCGKFYIFIISFHTPCDKFTTDMLCINVMVHFTFI